MGRPLFLLLLACGINMVYSSSNYHSHVLDMLRLMKEADIQDMEDSLSKKVNQDLNGLVTKLNDPSSLTCKSDMKIENIGCFKDNRKNRALPKLILTDRDKSSKVYSKVDLKKYWGNYEAYLSDLLCRCSKKAYSLGYRVIGLQFFGECWSGPDSHSNYEKIGVSDKCLDAKFKSMEHTSASSCKIGIGGENTNFVYRIRPTDCDIEYEPVGCYNDLISQPGRPLPHYLQNERDYSIKNWNGHLINWKEWDTYSKKMICRCAEKAKNMSYKIFGIQFWGECWAGGSGANYSGDGKSLKCAGKGFGDCPCNSYHCVGKAFTNYVYKLKKSEGPVIT